MTDRDSVRFGGALIEYRIHRTERRRKTVEITVGHDGVRVRAPAETSREDLRKLVRKRASWVLRQESERATAPPKRFVSGETLPYLGRNVRMTFEPADVSSPTVRFDHWRFRISEPDGLGGANRIDLITAALTAWYRTRAADRLPDFVHRWRPLLGQRPQPKILIRDQRLRWGSCGPDGALRFNWRVMMLPPALIEYVVVHEMVHLSVRRHSGEFWSLVREALPDADRRRIRLKDVGATLPF